MLVSRGAYMRGLIFGRGGLYSGFHDIRNSFMPYRAILFLGRSGEFFDSDESIFQQNICSSYYLN